MNKIIISVLISVSVLLGLYIALTPRTAPSGLGYFPNSSYSVRTNSSVTCNTTSTTLFTKGDTKPAYVCNDGAAQMYISLGPTATTTLGFRIATSSGCFAIDAGYTGPVSCAASSIATATILY